MRRDVFQAIADPVRREIIDILANQELSVNEVAEKFNISRPAVSKHLKILDECGILSFEKRGRERFCKVNTEQLVPAFLWIEKYNKEWKQKIDSFENYINQLKSKNEQNE